MLSNRIFELGISRKREAMVIKNLFFERWVKKNTVTEEEKIVWRPRLWAEVTAYVAIVLGLTGGVYFGPDLYNSLKSEIGDSKKATQALAVKLEDYKDETGAWRTGVSDKITSVDSNIARLDALYSKLDKTVAELDKRLQEQKLSTQQDLSLDRALDTGDAKQSIDIFEAYSKRNAVDGIYPWRADAGIDVATTIYNRITGKAAKSDDPYVLKFRAVLLDTYPDKWPDFEKKRAFNYELNPEK